MTATDKLQVRQRLAQACVITLISVSVTAPAVSLSSALPYFKVEQLLLPLILGIYAWLLLAGITRTVRIGGMFLVGFLYFVCNAFSIWYGSAIEGNPVIFSDLYELPKVLLPVVFFTVAYEAELSERGLRRLISVFSIAILFVCFYAWAQFANLSFTHQLNTLYSSGGHIDQALEFARRVYATVGNANVFGALMSWCFELFMLAMLYRVGNRAWNLLIASACFISMVMTGSRLDLLTAMLGLALVFKFAAGTMRRNSAQIAVIVLVLPIFLVIFQSVAGSNRRTLERYQTLSDPLQIDSFRERVDSAWPAAWSRIKQSPIVGHGPSKASYAAEIIDSEYLGLMTSTGTLGLVVFLGYYLYPLYLIRKGQRAIRRTSRNLAERLPATVLTAHFGFVVIVSALFLDIWMGTFYTPYLQAFLFLWLGVATRSSATLQEAYSYSNSAYAKAVRKPAVLEPAFGYRPGLPAGQNWK